MTTAGSGEQDLEPDSARMPLLGGGAGAGAANGGRRAPPAALPREFLRSGGQGAATAGGAAGPGLSPSASASTPVSTFERRRSSVAALASAAGAAGASGDGAGGDAWYEFRERLATFVERPESSKLAAAFQAVIMVLIITSTCAAIVETVPEVGRGGEAAFVGLEATVTVIFSAELALRFFACESAAAFLTNGFNIIDMVAILPGFVMLFGHFSSVSSSTVNAMMSLRMVRLMWLVRILRLVKVARHSRLLSVCIAVLTKVWHSSIVVILGLVLALTIVSSSMLYLVEYDRCQELGVSCKGFESIPHTCWFAISTLTTVGYGDVIPQTAAGKVIAIFFSIIAVMTLALAGALFSYDFAEHFREERERRHVELEVSLGSGRDQEFLELQDLACEVRSTCDALVARLAVAAAQRREVFESWSSRGAPGEAPAAEEAQGGGCAAGVVQAPPLVMGPMLKLIEERARMFGTEVLSCVYASSVDSKAKGDIQTLISYAGNVVEDVDLVATPHHLPPRLVSGV